MLARAFAKPSNILILDEPTNDLDHDTLDLLQELIFDYRGTILLVSHDRDFVDRVISATIAPSGDTPGIWIEYAGGYSDMVLQRKNVDEKKSNVIKHKDANYNKPPSKSSRMSFKEKHALEVLPEKIENLKLQISDIQNQMADPNFYNNENKKIEKVAIILSDNEKKLSKLEEQWLELELKREEIEGA